MEFFTCQWHQEVVFLGIMNILKCLIRLFVVLCAAATYSQAATIFDSTGDIDPGITTGNGTLDILSMEVSNNGTDIAFALTLNGNVSSTNWGKFMIGISTGSTASTNTGNGWGRPISSIPRLAALTTGSAAGRMEPAPTQGQAVVAPAGRKSIIM